MAGYFSNHSQSRFLSGTTTNAGQAPSGEQQPSPQPQRRPSKHFSTTVNTTTPAATPPDAQLSKDLGLFDNSNGAVHPLRNTWVFWFRQQRTPSKLISYEEGIKKISSCSSVESFWSLWTHLHTPSSLTPTTDYLVFHSGVHRPVWEDPVNSAGGKWILRLKKGVSDRLWEDLVLAVIGDQFDELDTEEEDGLPQICGCTISVRQHEDIISLWNKDEGDHILREGIKDRLKKVLNLPAATVMEYKTNNESMQDKSSFRTSTNVNERRL